MKEPSIPVSNEGEGQPQSAAYQLEDSVDHQGVVTRLSWVLQLEMEKCSVKQKIEHEITSIYIYITVSISIIY